MVFNILFISMSISAMITFKKHYVFFIMLIVASVLALPVSISAVFYHSFDGIVLLNYSSKLIYLLSIPVSLIYERRRKN